MDADRWIPGCGCGWEGPPGGTPWLDLLAHTHPDPDLGWGVCVGFTASGGITAGDPAADLLLRVTSGVLSATWAASAAGEDRPLRWRRVVLSVDALWIVAWLCDAPGFGEITRRVLGGTDGWAGPAGPVMVAVRGPGDPG